MPLKSIAEPFWTDDAELERYAGLKHPDSKGDDIGELRACFIKALSRSQFDLSFLNERFSDVSSWRSGVVAELKRAMSLPLHSHPVNSQILHRVKCDGYDREEVVFESAFGCWIPATVLIPDHGQAPFPAVVALHDMGGFRSFGREKLIPFEGEPDYLKDFRKTNYEGRSIGIELAARGFLVICIDSMMFGERTPQAWPDKAAFIRDRLGWTKQNSDQFTRDVSLYSEKIASNTAILTGLTWSGMIAGDDIDTVDYLVSRPDVDAGRIGCIGLSYGAYRANYLAALDERIAAAVSVCWMATLDSIVGFNVGGAMGYFTLIPGIHTRLDICDIASLACPRPFMAVSGWGDHLMQPHGISSAHRKLRKIWSKAGAAEKLGSLCFDSPHEFNTTMQEAAFAWLERWLGGKL